MSRPTTTSSSLPPPTTNPRSPHMSSIPPFPQLSPPTPVITPWIPYLIPFTFGIKTTAATEESLLGFHLHCLLLRMDYQQKWWLVTPSEESLFL
uniref:Uncharacterized protein n=1 Tax=Brassica oleracea TaxID=3712 RepID=A0A3P6FJY9_BRAOL|nr:unnamed protein product [Brassica oleracea]